MPTTRWSPGFGPVGRRNRHGDRRRTIRVGALLLALVTTQLAACSLPQPGAGESLVAGEVLADPVLTAPATCKGYVALTFDDGPTQMTPRLMAMLGRHDLPAMFFNTGMQSRDHAAIARQQAATPGVQLGNHSYSHPDLATLPPDQVRDEIVRTRDVQGKDVVFFRPPFGSANAEVLAQVEQLGMVNVLWTKDSKDFAATSIEQIVEQSTGMRDGGILLLHDGKRMTVRAVPLIAEHYYSKGLCFGKVARSNRAQEPAESPKDPFYAKAVAP